MNAKDARLAGRLRSRGWLVFDPALILAWSLQPGTAVQGVDPDGRRDVEPDTVTVKLRPAVPPDPCAAGCTNPAAHAEGGHDV